MCALGRDRISNKTSPQVSQSKKKPNVIRGSSTHIKINYTSFSSRDELTCVWECKSVRERESLITKWTVAGLTIICHTLNSISQSRRRAGGWAGGRMDGGMGERSERWNRGQHFCDKLSRTAGGWARACICVSAVFVLSARLIAEKLAEPGPLWSLAFSLGFNFCFVSPLSYSADLFLLCARARFVSLRTRCHQHTAPLHSGAGHGTASFENKAPILLFACDVCVCVCVRARAPPFIQIRYNLIAPRKGCRRRRRHTMLFASGRV